MAKRRSSDVNVNIYGGEPIVNTANIQKGDAIFPNPKGENNKKPRKLTSVSTIVAIIGGITAIIMAINSILFFIKPIVPRIGEKELMNRIIDGIFYDEKQQFIFTVPLGTVICHYSPRIDSHDLNRVAKPGDEIKTIMLYSILTKRKKSHGQH